jgi:L-lactate dehydrogenase complex protein LldF
MSLQALRRRMARAVADPDLAGPYERATATARAKRAKAVAELPDFEAQRAMAGAARRDAVRNLDALLRRFEKKFTHDGGRVHRARDAQEARAIVGRLIEEHGVRSVVKGKSMLSEELALNEYLLERGCAVHETDLGEFIVQIAGQRPSHITAPALHLDRQAIGALFTEKLGTQATVDPVALTAVARTALRPRFLEADCGITGANFLVAESGQIVLVENEANIRLCTTLPRLHIAVVGIEKIIGKVEELGPLLTVIARSATGQKMGSYVSILGAHGGPLRHVILVDNGRSALAASPRNRDILSCIRCGACLNACPVYARVGGHAYESAYSGPIGALLGPHHLGTDDGRELPFASSLCGACNEACPVEIDIAGMLRAQRERYVETGGASPWERAGWWMWAKVLVRPRLYRGLAHLARGVLRGAGIRGMGPAGARAWDLGRELPPAAESSFVSQWKDKGGDVSPGGRR